MVISDKGDDDLAISDLDAVLQLNPDHAGAYMLRGMTIGKSPSWMPSSGSTQQWGRMVADMTTNSFGSDLTMQRPITAGGWHMENTSTARWLNMAEIEFTCWTRRSSICETSPEPPPTGASAFRTPERNSTGYPSRPPTMPMVASPDDAKAYYRRGMAYGEQDLLDQALVDMCEAIRLGPDHADAYRGRGDCYRYKGEYDKALADFDTALRLDPENAAAHLGRGGAYRMKGDPDRAIADYDATLRLEPREPLAYRFRADAQIAKGNYDQAISDCNRALNLSPDDPIGYFTRGNAHLFSGQLELALADFNAAVEFDPTSGRSTYGRGLVRQLMGDAEGAADDYRRARDLGYDDRDPECEA